MSEISPESSPWGAILAGGRGSRLGLGTHQKALLRFGEQRLIDFTISSMVNAGINCIGLATWWDNHLLLDEVASHWPEVEFTLIETVRGGGTGQAMLAALRWCPDESLVLGTSDTILRPSAISRLLANGCPDRTSWVRLLLTHYIEDDDPIWVHLNDEGEVKRFGKGIQPSTTVFANVRWVSHAAGKRLRELASRDAELAGSQSSGSLIRALIDDPVTKVLATCEDPVFDIDRPTDMFRAECWFNEHRESWEPGWQGIA